VRSDLGVRNNHTSEHTLCLWNERTLPTTGFLGFSHPQETKHCNTVRIR
jgi:hypothetical protein